VLWVLLVKYLVIYTLEPIGVDGANEATGTHWYCSNECRVEGNPVDGGSPIEWDGAFEHGMATPDADGLCCETCMAPLREQRPVYVVAVYDCGQQFGGREEGGWWYDAGSLVRVMRRFRSSKAAYAYSNRLNGKLQSRSWGPNEGKREYTSVLSDGEYRACTFENTAPAGFPERRPRYE
jgi:hypothetical protein